MTVDEDLRSAFERHVHYSRGVLQVCDDLYQLDSFARVAVVAFGRSALSMSALLAERLGVAAGGLISAPLLDGQPQLPGFRYFHGGHPLPDVESFRAAQAMLKMLIALQERSIVIYLISAGSSFVEAPIDSDIGLDDLRATYQLLADSQCQPHEAKAILKHLSAVKGGRLALAASKSAQQVSIFQTGAKNDSLFSVACGPTMPDASSVDDCYQIASRYKLTERFPAAVGRIFEQHALEETPDKDHPVFHNCRWWPIQ